MTSHWLGPREYVEALRRDSVALAAAAADTWSAPVPACPGWTLADLLRHTGEVHRHKAALVRAGGAQDVERERAPVRDAHLLAWFAESAEDLADLLDGSDPEAPAWSWAGDHRVAFWQRRMAHETAVHRWDAEDAVGPPAPVDPPALAADGVDEVLTCFMPGQDELPYTGPAGSVHIHATDGQGEWVVLLGPHGVLVEAGHERCDAALRGTASDLDLVLWGRLPVGAAEGLGDERLLAALLAHLDTE